MEANPYLDQKYAEMQAIVDKMLDTTRILRDNTPDEGEAERFMDLAKTMTEMVKEHEELPVGPLLAMLLLRMTDTLREQAAGIDPDHYNFPEKACNDILPHGRHDWLQKNIPTSNPLVEHSQWYECRGAGE